MSPRRSVVRQCASTEGITLKMVRKMLIYRHLWIYTLKQAGGMSLMCFEAVLL